MIETSIRDAVQLQAFGEPNEMLKLYIGTTGLMHCGVSIFQVKLQKQSVAREI